MEASLPDADNATALQASILIAVFSYNRPAALANCLTSIADMCPGSDVVIFDDNSTHPDVAAVFRHFGHPVVPGVGGTGRHGGLYHNMQMAYERAIAYGYDYILMIQDDQQFLRPFAGEVLDEALGYFDAFENVTQVDLRFARKPVTLFELCDDVRGYRQVDPAYRSYVDVGLFKLSRLQSFGWSFAIHSGYVTAGEAKKAAEARTKGMRAIISYSPCLTHLPHVKVYRNRIRYPLKGSVRQTPRRHEYLTSEDIARIGARLPEEAPGREEYLRLGEPLDDSLRAILSR